MLQNLIKKVRGKPCPWLTQDIKTKMIDRLIETVFEKNEKN